MNCYMAVTLLFHLVVTNAVKENTRLTSAMTHVRLLCVESDAGFGVLYQALLRSHGFTVDLATSSSSAFEFLHSSQTHAVLVAHDLEVRDKEISGFELAVELKRRIPGLPVVVVSDCESLVEEARNFLDGAIAKSALLDEMVELMRSLTGREAARKPPFVHIMENPARLFGSTSKQSRQRASFTVAS